MMELSGKNVIHMPVDDRVQAASSLSKQFETASLGEIQLSDHTCQALLALVGVGPSLSSEVFDLLIQKVERAQFDGERVLNSPKFASLLNSLIQKYPSQVRLVCVECSDEHVARFMRVQAKAKAQTIKAVASKCTTIVGKTVVKALQDLMYRLDVR
jgi:hypothetical protein